ncbi:MAG: (S)-2-hydroxy-acid oxidase (EC [uncultured Campylobacterales bacterium]|uniref:(S)-2-hydroxy-acid oxidase (EC) n=1 Tax=uncultured Campylobacterales bacterium TaxID=352960 RepID=A0A6S6S1I9_9BACT|nr:MAG: (S)-2-hydroxy-acid oxidase (EC [uncultured Campylobacterales bacterium]
MIDKKHSKYFKKLLGEDNAHDDQAHNLSYSYDASRVRRAMPDMVLFPRDEQDISDILRYCNKNLINIVPRGAGSAQTGAQIATRGGVILAFEKHMNKILEIDMDNMVAVVQPGVINRDLQRAVEKVGLFYPPDPASQDFSSIGGNVVENAGGMRAAKYGITKDFVLGLRAVLPNGDIIRAGKKTIKDVAGYNICGTVIGSEGTLAAVSEITLKLISKPNFKSTCMGLFKTIDDAMNAVYKTMASGVVPVAMEFMDQLSIRAVKMKYPHIDLPEEAGAILISEVDSNTKNDIGYQMEVIEKYFMDNGAFEFRVAKNDEEAQKLWFARRNGSTSLLVYNSLKLNEDITVPRSNLPEMLRRIQRIEKEFDLLIPCYGHAGDGNIHTHVMVDGSDQDHIAHGHKCVEAIFKDTVELGGTISGEHGIGTTKAPYMKLAFNEEEMNLFRTLKKAFDPNNILNPGKLGIDD